MFARTMRSRVGWMVLAAGTAVVLAGCQGKSDVSGRVALDERPLVIGSVVFFPRDRLPIIAPIGEDGHYIAHGVPAGEEIGVGVYSGDPTVGMNDFPPGPDREKDIAFLKEQKKKWFPIPNRYNDPGQSGLSFTPSGSTFPHDIDLKHN
jgi:hypothetical protein